jgi:hypothetical protein
VIPKESATRVDNKEDIREENQIREILGEGKEEDEEEEENGTQKFVASNNSLWLARCNFLCLLNLPDMIHKFGSPRNYFEGKHLRERYVQEVKNARLCCPPKNLCENILRRLHQVKALHEMISSHSSLALKTLRPKCQLDTKKKP